MQIDNSSCMSKEEKSVKGRILKGIAGFYYVHIPSCGVYECKAKGIFRKDGEKPLVGDWVLISILNESEKMGNIISLLPRQSQIVRPAVANLDQALIIFAIVKPNPNFNLLDRFLIMMKQQGLPCVICFNKQDVATQEEVLRLRTAYEACGNEVYFVSAHSGEGMDAMKMSLQGKTTVLAGPSGVGKSSVINFLLGDERMETGAISTKIERGKHTTRHSEIFALEEVEWEPTYIMDTPGFSSLSLFHLPKEELSGFYPEFAIYSEECKFKYCSHISEPVCGVKRALAKDQISKIRYENYCLLYRELSEQKKTYPAKHVK